MGLVVLVPVGAAVLVSGGVLVVKLLELGEELCREAIGADLDRERRIGGGHEAHGNQTPQGEGQQQNGNDPIACFLIWPALSHVSGGLF